ncbi:MAG: ABC transporter substrate-binding protein [Hyphomicrobiaceae bacterium]
MAAPPHRIVSINLCTDQLLLALADRSQILALSRFSQDERLAYYRREAAGVAQTGGSAEEVIKLKPDLVLAGSVRRRETRARLAAFEVRLETFSPAQSIADVRRDIARMARLVGHEPRGAALIDQLDAALAGLKASGSPMSALQLQRRAFASGTGTLIDDLMRRAGLTNAAARLGVASVRRTTLETVLKARPDLLILDSDRIEAADQGVALLLHPALARQVPAERRIIVPLPAIVCGGPQVADAVKALADGMARVRAADRK